MADLHERRRQRVIRQSQAGAIGALLVAALLVSGVFYLGRQPTVETPTEPFFPAQVPGPEALPGQELFALACAPCHGVTASGNAAAGIPALNSAGTTWQLTADQIEEIILDGTGNMPANVGLLDREQARDIIIYLQTLWTEEQRAAFESGN